MTISPDWYRARSAFSSPQALSAALSSSLVSATASAAMAPPARCHRRPAAPRDGGSSWWWRSGGGGGPAAGRPSDHRADCSFRLLTQQPLKQSLGPATPGRCVRRSGSAVQSGNRPCWRVVTGILAEALGRSRFRSHGRSLSSADACTSCIAVDHLGQLQQAVHQAEDHPAVRATTARRWAIPAG